MCAVQHRFRPDAQLLRTFVAEGRPGRDLLRQGGLAAAAHRMGLRRVARGRSASRAAASCSTSASRCSISSLWMLGGPEVQSVTASVHRSRKGEVEDSATAFFRLGSGATLTLELTWGLLMEKDFAYLNLFGSGGAALLNPLRIHKGMHGTLVNVTPDAWTPRAHQYRSSIDAQIAHFADVLRKGVKPMGRRRRDPAGDGAARRRLPFGRAGQGGPARVTNRSIRRPVVRARAAPYYRPRDRAVSAASGPGPLAPHRSGREFALAMVSGLLLGAAFFPARSASSPGSASCRC